MNKDNLNLKDHLFLFDIDGTILDSKGAGKRAFIQSFEKVLNEKIDNDINFLGGIDNVIFKELYFLKKLSEKDIDEKWIDFQKEYLKIMLETSENDSWEIFNNADYIIELLSNISNIALVTGNIKKGAIIKLNKVKLDHYFRCGGFGDKITTRAGLVNEAINESEIYYKKTFNKKNIYLFGDTQKDVDSAILNNINPILIDTRKKYFDQHKNWNIEYHNDFSRIDEFLKKIVN